MLWRAVKAMAGAAVAVFLLAAPAGAQVPDPYARELAGRLARADQLVGEANYSRAAGPFAGGLRRGEARRFSLTLRAGQEYRIVGVCDQRCRDMNLRLFDANGVLVREDVLRDTVPTMEVRPNATGVHEIEVLMPACAAAGPCFFAFNVYAR